MGKQRGQSYGILGRAGDLEEGPLYRHCGLRLRNTAQTDEAGRVCVGGQTV